MDQEKRRKSGLATPEEIARLEEIWRNASKDTSFESDHTAKELENIEQEMFQSIKLEILKRERHAGVPLFSRPMFYKAAAIVLILLSAVGWWYANSSDSTEIRNGFGERLTVTLPDQSTVVLNGNSVLRYSNNWDEKPTREVWIEGEGFFSVTHTRNHQRFIVHASGELNVEVLGTKFNVKARHGVSEVMLTEGSVKLGLAQNTETAAVFLEPGELATMNNKRLSKRTVKQHQYTSWVQNKLFFERTALSEVAALLEDTYGLKVIFRDTSLQKREISGEISSATVDDILYAIAETFNLKVEKAGKSAIISLRTN